MVRPIDTTSMERIQGWRDAGWAKFTQLARAAGISDSRMSRIWNGEETPSNQILIAWRDEPGMNSHVVAQCREELQRRAAQLTDAPARRVNPDVNRDGRVDDADRHANNVRMHRAVCDFDELYAEASKYDRHAFAAKAERIDAVVLEAIEARRAIDETLSPSARVTAGRFSPHTAGASSHGAPAPANRKGTR